MWCILTHAHTCTTTLTQGFFQRCPSPPEGVSLEVQEGWGAIPIDLETPTWLGFCHWQNLQMHTLNTACEVIQVKPNRLKKKKNDCPSSCKFHWQCCIRYFSHFGLLLTVIKPVLPAVRCVQLKFIEITSLVPHPAFHRLTCIVPVMENCMGGSLGTRLLIQYSLWIRIHLAYDHS